MDIYQEAAERGRILDGRNDLVVKSNELLRNTRYTLKETEQKLLIYIISKIEPEDKEFKQVDISIVEYCKVAGIKTNSGNIYSYIKKQIKELADKSCWIPIDGKKEILFRWIDKATVDKAGIISIKLHDNLKPFLIDLKSNFTKYELINVLTLQGKYAIRLYELFKSYLWKGHWEVSVKDLKDILNVKDKYPQFKEFKRNCITPAIEEINRYTDLQVECKSIYTGKSITDLHFVINAVEGYQLIMDIWKAQKERLD